MSKSGAVMETNCSRVIGDDFFLVLLPSIVVVAAVLIVARWEKEAIESAIES